MKEHTKLIHKRNQLMVKLLWFFLVFSVLVNSFVDPEILVVIIPAGFLSCLVATVLVRRQWLVEKTPCIMITFIYGFFITLTIYEPLFINFIYIWFALILSSIYQDFKPIVLAGVYTLSFTIYAYFYYFDEVFPFMDREDIVYMCLFAIFVTVVLIYASKFNDHLRFKLEREKCEAEELLRNSDKLATVGQLAAGVAHEIRNPLSVISGYIQLLKKDQKQSPYFDIIHDELNRINSIISEFLLLSKPNSLHLETKDLKVIIEDVITLLSAQANFKNVVIEMKKPANAVEVECEENQIKQVLINLVKNGIEAMPSGGILTIELVDDNHHAKIRISDEGVGIPKDELTRLGQPFYTTKETGTGLGLMVSLKILEHHQGSIIFNSVEGEGTMVEVTLPKSEGNR